MGFYIQCLSDKCKAQYLVSEYSAKIIPKPKKFLDIDADKAIICVIDNGEWEAAGFCYCEMEFKRFSNDDGRKKVWLIMDKNIVNKLTGLNNENKI
jgi:hypothetical protein